MRLEVFIEACHAALLSEDTCAVKARDYLISERGIRMDTIQRFKIGYCNDTQELPDTEPPHGRMLHNKIIVPVWSDFGEVVGCGARIPDKAEKGWVNNTGWTKGKHLFLLNVAREAIFDANKAYLFEGYTDGIVAHQEGLPNAVSELGTALGLRLIGLLKRYTNRVCVCLDTDKESLSGQVAQAKQLLSLSEACFEELYSIQMPEGVDPDEFILKNGLRAFYEMERPVGKSDLKTCAEFIESVKEKRKRERKRK